MFGSAFSACTPPAACQDYPAVSTERSISSTSVQPNLARWYSAEAPTTPPQITTTQYYVFMSSLPKGRKTIIQILQNRSAGENSKQLCPRSNILCEKWRVGERFIVRRERDDLVPQSQDRLIHDACPVCRDVGIMERQTSEK